MKTITERIIHIENGTYHAKIYENGYWELFDAYAGDCVRIAGMPNHATELQKMFTEIALQTKPPKPNLPLSPEEIRQRYGKLAE